MLGHGGGWLGPGPAIPAPLITIAVVTALASAVMVLRINACLPCCASRMIRFMAFGEGLSETGFSVFPSYDACTLLSA